MATTPTDPVGVTDEAKGVGCGDVLSLPAQEAVRKECVLPKGHKGFCKSDDGRAWETHKGRHG